MNYCDFFCLGASKISKSRATRARARPFVRASTRSLARPSRGNHARAPIARARRSMGARDRIRLERVDSSCFLNSHVFRVRARDARLARFLAPTIDRIDPIRFPAGFSTARARTD